MLKIHGFQTLTTPSSPEYDLQQISMYDDILFSEQYNNVEKYPIQPNFISGWIRPQRIAAQDGLFNPQKSKILKENTLLSLRRNISQYNNRKKGRSFSIGINDHSHSQRPKSTQFHIKRAVSHKMQLDGRSREPIHLTGLSFQLKTNLNKTKLNTVLSRSQKKDKTVQNHVKFSIRNVVPFPMFNVEAYPEKPVMRATAVGKIRTMIKTRLKRKE